MESKPVQPGTEVLKVSDEKRVDLALAFMRKRAAVAEYQNNQLGIERLIERLDKDGQLRAAIQNGGALSARLQEAEVKLTAVLEAIQKEAGTSLTGYSIDGDTGNLVRPLPPPSNPDVFVPPAKAKRKSKK